MHLHRLTATEAAALLAKGEISSEALVRACLERIDEREADVRAWVVIDRERALAAARAADRTRRERGGDGSPLLGIPIGVKDTINTVDLPTEYNSPIFRGHRSGSDAPVVALLRNAGAIVLGKTETVEFAAHGRPAPTRNPRDLSHTPSGSSSGSAAAVADDMVPLALGSQTGGSLIRPGSHCGCIGFKPTYGMVSTEGVKLFSVSLDTMGWYARSVADISLVAGVLFGETVTKGVVDVAGLNIGVCRTPYWDRADQATHTAIEETKRRLELAGAAVADFELGPEFAEIRELQETIMCGEGYFAFSSLLRCHGHGVSDALRARIKPVPVRTLLSALDEAATLRSRFHRMIEGFDAILTPSAPGEAPPMKAAVADATFNGMWTLLHVPCITLSGLAGPAGLPVGVQLVARRGEDAHLIKVADAVAPLLIN
jgi:Asp-tRNA(Asn)/Glu-tRNA(Gln) amidotransferase A subunit family amidase